MAFAKLWSWLKGRPLPRADRRVVLFTRAACPLCEEAHALLERYQRLYGFVLETRNVDESEDWRRDYGESVPVVTIDGIVRFRGRVNEVLLRRLLEA